MSISAIETRRQRTLHAIARCARDLAGKYGLDGFTMDQLAECVGVSRRTLFNYVPSKVDAVLGTGQAPDPSVADEFLAGGPTGDLLHDIKFLVCEVLDEKDSDPAQVDEIRRLLRSDPRLHDAVQVRFAEMLGNFSDALEQREGRRFDPLTVKLIAGLTIGSFDLALDESLADTSMTLSEHYGRVFDRALAVFSRGAL